MKRYDMAKKEKRTLFMIDYIERRGFENQPCQTVFTGYVSDFEARLKEMSKHEREKVMRNAIFEAI